MTEELLTGRLSLRRPAPGDVPTILAVHADPLACAHNPSDALATMAEAEELYQRWDEHWRSFGFGYWVVRLGATPVGFCGLKAVRLHDQAVLNLFYRLAPTSWNQGIATEAATAVVRWATARQPRQPVIARVRPENIASQRVATRTGLVRAEHLDGPGYDGFDWVYTSAG